MWLLLGLLVSLVAVYLLYKPNIETPKSAEDEVGVPKVEEGAQAGRVYGTYWIEDSQVHWFGDISSSPITKQGGKK